MFYFFGKIYTNSKMANTLHNAEGDMFVKAKAGKIHISLVVFNEQFMLTPWKLLKNRKLKLYGDLWAIRWETIPLTEIKLICRPLVIPSITMHEYNKSDENVCQMITFWRWGENDVKCLSPTYFVQEDLLVVCQHMYIRRVRSRLLWYRCYMRFLRNKGTGHGAYSLCCSRPLEKVKHSVYRFKFQAANTVL